MSSKKDDDEVEKLLRAAEEEILLKLSVDSHISRGSSSEIIHPDLDRRFQALRSKFNPKPPSSSIAANSSNIKPPNKASVAVDDYVDVDLFARFSALKSTLPSYSNTNQIVENINDNDEGDEVDEIIRWAIDAAALDPSPPSDDDDDSSCDDQTDDDDEDDAKKEKNKKKKGVQKVE